MNTILIVCMLLAATTMIWALARHRAGGAWGRPLAVVCAVIALACALGHILAAGGPSARHVAEAESAYLQVCGQRLGCYLAEKCPGAKALVVTDPMRSLAADAAGAPPPPNPLTKGLRQGLAGKVTIVAEAAPELPAAVRDALRRAQTAGPGAGPGMPVPDAAVPGGPDLWFTAAAFDDLVSRYQDKCDLIISTIGLPRDVQNLRFWSRPQRPKLVLAFDSTTGLRRLLERGLVTAAVVMNPRAVFTGQNPPANLERAFASRYLLLTPQNIGKMATEFGEPFGG